MLELTRRSIAGVLGLALVPAFARTAGADDALAEIERNAGGRLGVAVSDAAGRMFAAHRGGERFPMVSTFKLLLVGATLSRVDAGTESLDRRIRFGRDDLVTYSPVTETRVGDGLTVGELCEATATLSDNTAANLLLQALGGPAGLTAWLRALSDGVTRLDRMEPALNEARPGDPRDTSSPLAFLETMHALTLGGALREASRDRLVGWMRANRTGGARLRAGVPAGWTVGDRTGGGGHGTSNVVGLLWPPDGSPPRLVVAFLTESAADATARDAALAKVGTVAAAARRE